jgi:hypothetical protein
VYKLVCEAEEKLAQFKSNNPQKFNDVVKKNHTYDKLAVDCVLREMSSFFNIDETRMVVRNFDHNKFKQFFMDTIGAMKSMGSDQHLVLKIGHIHTKPIMHFIYYMSRFFKKVHVIRPRTVKMHTDEQYIVAQCYNNELSQSVADHIDGVFATWTADKYCRYFDVGNIEAIEGQFYSYNLNIAKNIIYNINKVIDCDNVNPHFQHVKSVEFCNIFGVSEPKNIVCENGHKFKKIQVYPLKNAVVCEKCFKLFIVKKNDL